MQPIDYAFIAIILAIILFFVFVSIGATSTENMMGFHQYIFRYLHVISGVMWIGLLWYLNFVQVPTMPKIQPPEIDPIEVKIDEEARIANTRRLMLTAALVMSFFLIGSSLVTGTNTIIPAEELRMEKDDAGEVSLPYAQIHKAKLVLTDELLRQSQKH